MNSKNSKTEFVFLFFSLFAFWLIEFDFLLEKILLSFYLLNFLFEPFL